jgi:hypothetical protein
MAGEYKAACGCKIHVAQWTAKRKVVTQESCSLHKAAADLLAGCKALLPEGWDNGVMDHIPGVQIARLAIAKAEGKEVQQMPDFIDEDDTEG